MKRLDVFLQRWRISKVRPYLRPGARVLDIGCGDGALFRYYATQISEGIGLDPTLERAVALPNARLLPSRLTDALPEMGRFELVTVLAVLEHLELPEQMALTNLCAKCLNPGGFVVITVPSPRVDSILRLLLSLRLIDGMQLHEHHGFEPSATSVLFALPGLHLVTHRRFQLGLNHLFVFQRAKSHEA